MKEQIISVETARLLKEKGFDEKCYSTYDKFGHVDWLSVEKQSGFGFSSDEYKEWLFEFDYSDMKKEDREFYILAPTQSLAQKWLREKHKLHLAIVYSQDHNKYSVEGWDEFHWRELSKRDPRSDGRFPCPYKSRFLSHYWDKKTYEDALEYGILESLKLINKDLSE